MVATDWNRVNNSLSRAVLAAGQIEHILDDLGCNLKSSNRRTFRGPCPIHEGDGDSFSLEVGEDDAVPIRWVCFSNRCQDEYKPSLLGLVRGVLSTRDGRKVHPRVAADFLARYAGEVVMRGGDEGFTPKPPREPRLLSIDRDAVRRRLTIPSPYFLARGFSRDVLEAFDVGESATLMRAVIPLYDNDEGRVCIGFLARSYRPRCERCRKHHDGPECRYGQSKWRMADDFPADRYLYNYAAAKATAAPFVFLAEGAPDVFRLTEMGLVGVATLGSDVSADQFRMLAALGKEIWVAFDNDEGGRKAEKSLRSRQAEAGIKLPGTSFRPPAPYKDFGDTPAPELAASILSTLESKVSLCEDFCEIANDPRDVASLANSRRRLDDWMRYAGRSFKPNGGG